MKKIEPKEKPEAVPDELLSILVDRAVRHIRPVVRDADLDDVRAAVRTACESDPVLLLLLRNRDS